MLSTLQLDEVLFTFVCFTKKQAKHVVIKFGNIVESKYCRHLNQKNTCNLFGCCTASLFLSKIYFFLLKKLIWPVFFFECIWFSNLTSFDTHFFLSGNIIFFLKQVIHKFHYILVRTGRFHTHTTNYIFANTKLLELYLQQYLCLHWLYIT